MLIASLIWLQQSTAAAPVKGGITISPAFQQLTLDPSQERSTFNFSVTNNSDQEYEFKLSVIDFGSLDETGGVLFIGDAKKALNYKYGLSQWATLEKDRVVVAARATEKIPVSIVNKESLAPGGHYGAVLVQPTEAANGEKVQVDQVASSLLFVKKQGGEIYRLLLNKTAIGKHLFSLPDNVNLRFQNAGNVHVIPRGTITLSDPRGNVVKKGIINPDSGIVLPETFRQLSTPLMGIARSWLPGRYTATVQYRYDDQPATTEAKLTFYYLNLGPFLIAFGVITLLIGLLVRRQTRRYLLMPIRYVVKALKRLQKPLKS